MCLLCCLQIAEARVDELLAEVEKLRCERVLVSPS